MTAKGLTTKIGQPTTRTFGGVKSEPTRPQTAADFVRPCGREDSHTSHNRWREGVGAEPCLAVGG